MTNEQLTAYLQDESYLYTLGYEELKTLVVQYPYAANLRVLLLKKAYLEQNKDYDRHLQMASAYTTNRRFLYKTIKRLKTLQVMPENVILGEDFLELTSLSDLDKYVKEKQEVQNTMSGETAKALSAGFILDFESPNLTQEDEDDVFDMSISTKEDADFEQVNADDLDILVDNLVHEYQQNGVNTESTFNISAKTELFEEDLIEDATIKELEDDDLIVDNTSINEDSIINNEINKMVSFKNGHSVESIINNLQPDIEHIPLPEENQEQEEINPPSPVVVELEEVEDSNNFKEEPTSVEPIEVVETREDYFENKVETNIEEKNNIEISENQLLITFETNKQLFDTAEDDDMKKQDIELEIINKTKATVVSNDVAAETPVPRVSFTEWLQQFRMVTTSPNTPTVEAKKTPKPEPNAPETTSENQISTIKTTSAEPLLITDLPNSSSRLVQQESMAQVLQVKEELPSNLFNLNIEETIDEDEYKDKIEAIFDDFLNHKGHEKNENTIIQVIENQDNNTQNTEGVVNQQTLMTAEDHNEEEDDDELPHEVKKVELHAWAKESILEDEDFVSETLAEMFSKQGNYKKAIEIYERLSLQIPEKSNFFAAKIKDLRIKIMSIF